MEQQEWIARQQSEMRDLFAHELQQFIARLVWIDQQTPGAGDIPPGWWSQLSDLRRECARARERLQVGTAS